MSDRKFPAQTPWSSKQNYETPPDFIEAVKRRFGEIRCDLAADATNAKAPVYFDETSNSLAQPWAESFPTGVLWLNPPFKNIDPWAEKCALESKNRHGLILLLTPASVGTVWFDSHVHRKALVLGLSPRLTFVGETKPYPKDLMLSVFGYGANGFDTWRWK